LTNRNKNIFEQNVVPLVGNTVWTVWSWHVLRCSTR